MRHDLLNVKVCSQHTVPATVIAIILWVQFENYLEFLLLLETDLLIHKSMDVELIDVTSVASNSDNCTVRQLHRASFRRHSDIPKCRVIVKHAA